MKSLLDVSCYLIIFTDEYYYNIIKEYRNDKLTYYVVMDIDTLNSFQYKERVRENRMKYHPTKDERTCIESHLLCSSKFDFVLKSIE